MGSFCKAFNHQRLLPTRKERSVQVNCAQSSSKLIFWINECLCFRQHGPLLSWNTMVPCALMLKHLQLAKVNKAGFSFKARQEASSNNYCEIVSPSFQKGKTHWFFPLAFYFSSKTEDRWGGAINCPKISGERPSGRSNTTPPGKQNRWKDTERPTCLQEFRLYFPQRLVDKH